MIRQNVWRRAILPVALLSAAFFSSASRAQDNLYATLEIHNGTPDISITYSIRWGTAAWKEYTVKPGEFFYHWYPYDVPNQNKSPNAEISFNPGITRNRAAKTYTLDRFASPFQKKGGKPYHFATRTEASGEVYYDLFNGDGKTAVAKTPAPVVKGLVKTSPPPQQAAGLEGSTWSGTETLAGYGDLAFRFQADGKATMTDKDGDTAGTWRRDGNTITLQFGASVTYTGTRQGGSLRGSAKSGDKTWTFAVSNPAALAREGWELITKYDYDQAIARLSDAIRGNPGDAHAHALRGYAYAYSAKADFDKGLADCAEAIRLNPNLSTAYNVRGLIYRMQGDFDEAVSEHSKAIRLAPKDYVLYSNRGLAYLAKKSYDEAIKDQTEAIRLKPKEPEYLIRRARAYYDKKVFDPVIEDCTEAIRIQPDRAIYHNFRGAAYHWTERYDDALADFTQAIRLDPKFALAYSNRGAAYLKKQDYDRAIFECTEAIRIDPKTDKAYWWRSQAYAKTGKAANAKADYEKSIQLNPANQQLSMDVEYGGRSFAPVANRQEALRALRSFQLGSTISATQLDEINQFPRELKYLDKLQTTLPKDTQELIRLEKIRHEKLELEMIAAADRFLSAAKLSPAARQAEGLDLQWLYGPVTPVEDRFRSTDDLGGMRLIGRLVFKDGREITAILPLSFYPNIDVEEDGNRRGRPGILWGADNFRIIVKLNATGTPMKDFAHQSFSINNKEDGTQNMKPGFNINPDTGLLVDPYIRGSALGTRCFDCHKFGSNLYLKYKKGPQTGKTRRQVMAEKEYPTMEGFAEFLKLAVELGASKTDREHLEQSMRKDPAALIPVDELLRANEDYWIRRYPDFKKRIKDARPKQLNQERLPGALREPFALPAIYWHSARVPIHLPLWSTQHAVRIDSDPDAVH